jgi:hypothetical protein
MCSGLRNRSRHIFLGFGPEFSNLGQTFILDDAKQQEIVARSEPWLAEYIQSPLSPGRPEPRLHFPYLPGNRTKPARNCRSTNLFSNDFFACLLCSLQFRQALLHQPGSFVPYRLPQ